MVGEDELCHSLAGANYAGRIGADHHPFGYHSCTGWGQIAPAVDFHHADAAGGRGTFHAGSLEVYMAQGGDVDAHGGGSIQYGSALRYGNRSVIYSELNHFFHSALLK